MLILVVIVVIGIMASIWAIGFKAQISALKMIDKKTAANNVATEFHDIFWDGTICGCHLGQPSVVVDATLTGGEGKVTLAAIRRGCNATDPVYLGPGVITAKGLKVTSVELADLKPVAPGSLEWDGEWRVYFDPENETSIRPASFRQKINLDPVSYGANPTQTKVLSCLPAAVSSGALIQYCPAGWTMVGPSGRVGTFCIETAEHPGGAMGYNAATAACAATAASSLGFPHLCGYADWYLGCKSGSLTAATDGSEWNIEYGGSVDKALTNGNGSCESVGKADISGTNLPFRCCFP